MALEFLYPYARNSKIHVLESIRKEREKWMDRKSVKIFKDALESIKDLKTDYVNLTSNAVEIGKAEELNEEQKTRLNEAIKTFMPWRKGPWNLFDTYIDSEWKSNLKWDRVSKEAGSLYGKKVADVGCHNGYFLFKMAEQKPKFVLGVDPTPRFKYSFNLMQNLAKIENIYFELFGAEHMGLFGESFNVIFCLGVIYHHRDPLGMLDSLFAALRPGGKLILESLGIPGEESVALFPEKRYTQIPGMWFVPTESCLVNWLKRSGFKNVKPFFSHKLDSSEQRVTELGTTKSLDDFMDPNDKNKTIEGYPAPMRFYISAQKP